MTPRLWAWAKPNRGGAANADGGVEEVGGLTAMNMGERYWLAMPYQCEGCGFEVEFLLEDGCEGPKGEAPATTPSGRLIVPVPYIAGPCPACRAAGRGKPRSPLLPGMEIPPELVERMKDPVYPAMTRIRWRKDRKLSPMVEGPLETPHFRYPAEVGPAFPNACGRPVYAGGN